MNVDTCRAGRTSSHAEYIQTLHRPSAQDVRRISEIQCRKELEIDSKYHTTEQHEAARTIQKAYRGHRARRELGGLTLDPSARWIEIIREWRYRRAIATQYEPGLARLGSDGRPRAPSDVAKLNWERITQIAEHAGAGEAHSPVANEAHELPQGKAASPPHSMLMDQRYFLEMVDQKHRYGTNLMVYHEEWLRSRADQTFFYWLDHGHGKHISLAGCSREQLESEWVRYLSKDEKRDYLVKVDEEGKLRWQKNNELVTTSAERYRDSLSGIVPCTDIKTPSFDHRAITEQLDERQRLVNWMETARNGSLPLLPYMSETSSSDASDVADPVKDHPSVKYEKLRKLEKRLHVSPATILNHLMRASIKPGTWIYVADTVGRVYVGIKASGAFQHASFLSGARISSAGAIGIENGQLTYLSPLSGHYRPTTKSFKEFMTSLDDQGVDLSLLRVSRSLAALMGLERYAKTKKSIRQAVHHHEHPGNGRKSPRRNVESQPPLKSNLAREVNQNLEPQHDNSLPMKLDNFHLQKAD